MLRPPVLITWWAVLIVCGCSNGRTEVGSVEPTAQVRIESANSSGDGDRLAAELMLVSGAGQASPLRPAFELPNAGLRAAIEAIAFDHLRTVATTDGLGPDLAGSLFMRRLALDRAPPDRNGNGSNLDETVRIESARIASFAGLPMPTGVVQSFLPWAEESAELVAPLAPGPEPDPASWRVVHHGRAVVRLEHLAGAMRLRAMAAGQLLQQQHGSFVGRTGQEGRLGLLLTQQLLAAEETLLGALSTDSTTGGPLGPVPDPAEYDPDQGLRWFPAAFTVLIDPALPGVPTGYTTVDVASDLVGLSLLLQAAAETVWVASLANPSPSLRAVFRGEPFPEPASGPPPPPVLNWQQNVAPLINFRCSSCHTGTFPEGQFNVKSLASVMFGSPRTRLFNLEMIVPFDHANSFLWRIVTPPPPGPPFQQMPQGTSGLVEPERDLIADWIDAGALEFPPQAPPPPVAGQDLLRVCFVNLVAMHFDPLTGALHHRHEGDGISGFATAASTGAALRALHAAAVVMPDLEFRGMRPVTVLTAVAKFAAKRFFDAGRAAADIDLQTGVVGDAADLAGQAALTSGLLAAVELVPDQSVRLAARDAADRLLTAFADPATGAFRTVPEHPFARYTPSVLADLLAALRSLQADTVLGSLPAAGTLPDSGATLERLLATLRPVLAHAEWETSGEVLGDGIADTNQNGVPEPAAAGGQFGRLPLLAGAILVGDPADAPAPTGTVTWSAHVRPLLFEQCASCHFAGSPQSTYRLDTRRLVATPGTPPTGLPTLVPFDAESSLLYRKLVDRIPPVGAQMPLDGTPMSSVQREIVRKWIETGASSR
jgi:hypothetical protein